MKKNILLALGAMSLISAFGVSAVQKANVVETKADDVAYADRVYLGGGTNESWDLSSDKKFTYLGEASAMHLYRFTGTISSAFKVMITYDGTSTSHWINKWNSTNASAKSSFNGGSAGGGDNIFATGSGWGKQYTFYFRVDFSDPSAGEIYEIVEGDANDGTVYFVNGYAWSDPKIHAWNDNGALLGWPGASFSKVDSIKLSAAVDNDQYGSSTTWYDQGVFIWKATIPSIATNIIINDGSGTQTADLDFTNNGVYSWRVNEKFFGVVSLLINTVNSMDSASYDGKTYTQSICGISNPAAIINAYNTEVGKADSEVVKSAKESVIVTNDVDHYGSTTDVSMKKIAAVLSNKPSGANTIISGTSSQNSAALIAGLAVLGLAAGGTMVFLAKRRKEI